MDAFDILTQAATEEIHVAGFDFRVRRVTHREMLAVRSFQLLLVGVPSEDRAGLAQTVKDMILQGGDPAEAVTLVEHAIKGMLDDVNTDALAAKAEEMSLAILGAGLTAYRVAAVGAPDTPGHTPAGPWRPVSVVLAGDPQRGDGTTPDVLPVRLLPGGGGTAELLSSTILRMSGTGAAEAARMARFRLAAGPGAAPAPDGEGVRTPPE